MSADALSEKRVRYSLKPTTSNSRDAGASKSTHFPDPAPNWIKLDKLSADWGKSEIKI